MLQILYGYPSLANIVVSGHQTAWLPLQYWADGTIKVAQAQFTDPLPTGGRPWSRDAEGFGARWRG